MKSVKNQSGFTLVELIVVLAITSLLLMGALAGKAVPRDQAKKMGSIDTLKNQLEKLRIEANTSVSQAQGKSGYTHFGKIVEFIPPTTMRVYTLIGPDDNSRARLTACLEQTVQLEQGIELNSTPSTRPDAIIFVRKSDTLPDRVFTGPNNYRSIPNNPPIPGCSPPPYVSPLPNYGCSPSATPPSTCPATPTPSPPVIPPPNPRDLQEPRNYQPGQPHYNQYIRPITLRFTVRDVLGEGRITIDPASGSITRAIE